MRSSNEYKILVGGRIGVHRVPDAFPIAPMLAKLADELPVDGFSYEPKWDGFRAIVFRGASEVFMQSRDLRPLDRYFPELRAACLAALPGGCVVDGEIVIATPRGLDFDALQLRLHPAASRVARLAEATPASFVAFDLLAVEGRDLRGAPQHERRLQLERLLAAVAPPLHLTPMTRDPAVAADWLSRFEGAGLDGVIAKSEHAPYQPGARARSSASVDHLAVHHLVEGLEVGDLQRPDGIDGRGEDLIGAARGVRLAQPLARRPERAQHLRAVEALSLTVLAEAHGPPDFCPMLM
ncbi:MAG: hypothetical protein HY657_19505 [Acidobacteria bacterium]|nr:hypothetical protein [Acidobacteriota bacterium]